MGDIIGIVIFLGLIYLLFKMLGRYIWPAVLIGAIGAVIGAIWGKDGTWEYYAYGGAAIGLILCFIVDFSNAWKTILGCFVGGLIGAGIAFLIGNGIWASNIFLGLIIAGGALASSAAMEDLFAERNYSSGRSSRSISEDEPEEKKKWTDAMGDKRDYEPVNRCGTCSDFDSSRGYCTRNYRYVDSNDYGCQTHTMW